jgi:hypothetical protein
MAAKPQLAAPQVPEIHLTFIDFDQHIGLKQQAAFEPSSPSRV